MDKVMEKIKRLLALANCPTGNVNETAAAAEAAQRLMLEYKISEVNFDETPEDESITEQDILQDSGTTKPRQWEQMLATQIAANNFCKLILSTLNNKTRFRVFGKTSDVQAVSYMYQAITRQVRLLANRFVGSAKDRNSFKYGCAVTICRRLRESNQTSIQNLSSTAIVKVDTANKQVEDFVNKVFPHLKTKNFTSCSSARGYYAGKVAGEQVTLGGKAALKDKTSALPG